ncbi:MAG TPA: DUF4031 domain-containing protein [Elusimicrobiales bacterium]|nr:DUF4031 domain-containing protein [Elusimicrobiales bacterium]
MEPKLQQELDLFCLTDGCMANCERLKKGDCPFKGQQAAEPASPPAMVYVDALHPCAPTLRWPFTASCHLYARDLNTLHDFAARLGLKRSWFQGNAKLPHYDLTGNKRAQAVRLGAAEREIREVMDVRDGRFYWKGAI